MKAKGIATKRVYEKPSASDGARILVDRLWPRGISKQKARISLWLKEVAPGSKLREWFSHDPAKWKEFKTKYFKELDANAKVVSALAEKSKHGKVTLVYAAKDELHNNALALKEYLEKMKA